MLSTAAMMAFEMTWDPGLRGVLIVVVGTVVLCGSVYLLLGTNLGARLGFLVAVAGIAGTLTLYRILRQRCPSPGIATITMLAWLAGNGFLGAQFSWILRPFFGSPRLEVALFRPDPMHGSFYEAVWRSLDHSTGGNAAFAITGLLLGLAIIAWPVVRTLYPRTQLARP